MNQTVTANNTKPKGELCMLILSIICIACRLIGNITYFIQYQYCYDWYSGEYYELGFCLPNFMSIIFMLLNFAPAVLLMIYFISAYGKAKPPVLITVACGVISLMPVVSIVYNGISGAVYTTKSLVMDGAFTVAFFLAAVFVMIKGKVSKVFVIVAASVGIVDILTSVYNFFQSAEYFLDNEMYLYLITNPMYIIAGALLYTVLLVFGICYSGGGKVLAQKQVIDPNLPPDRALYILSEKYQLGIISENEYRRLRNEIIDRL